jgi:hypothetical protein
MNLISAGHGFCPVDRLVPGYMMRLSSRDGKVSTASTAFHLPRATGKESHGVHRCDVGPHGAQDTEPDILDQTDHSRNRDSTQRAFRTDCSPATLSPAVMIGISARECGGVSCRTA